VKAANQVSSLGITILTSEDASKLNKAIDKSFFIQRLDKKEWSSKNDQQKVAFVRMLSDIRDGIGIPMVVTSGNKSQNCLSSEELLNQLNQLSRLNPSEENILLESCDAESEVVIDSFYLRRNFHEQLISSRCGQLYAYTKIKKKDL